MQYSSDPYEPCSCGSGKKYKFCCYQKERDLPLERFSTHWVDAESPSETDIFASLKAPALAESMLLNSKGLRLLAAADYEGAIKLFRQAMLPGVEDFYSPANNQALCLYVTGRLAEAISVQSQSLKDASFPNPFGLASLATLHYINGDEALSRQCLDDALKLPMPSADACIKVCEALARFKRHQDILTLADASPYRSNLDVCFFTGVAAANLGDRVRAQQDLGRQKESHYKSDVIRRYRAHLREGTAPHTVLGDWPYLYSQEICPHALLEVEFLDNLKGWRDRRVILDVCEVFCNEKPSAAAEALDMLENILHPDAIPFLWKIANGSFGPDEFRIKALTHLQHAGEVNPGQEVEVLIKGKREKIILNGTRLNPEFRFGGKLPEAVDAIYTKASMDMHKKKPNWAVIEKVFKCVMNEAPDYYPARFNYAVSLLHQGFRDEAEEILRALIQEQPEYLFAWANLLHILIGKECLAEAEKLIKKAPVPEETHPQAMAAWLVAKTCYFEAIEDDNSAADCIASAYDIDPDHPAVQAMYDEYWGE
jgi:tetratricopeptide (TPR) repeat protein